MEVDRHRPGAGHPTAADLKHVTKTGLGCGQVPCVQLGRCFCFKLFLSSSGWTDSPPAKLTMGPTSWFPSACLCVCVCGVPMCICVSRCVFLCLCMGYVCMCGVCLCGMCVYVWCVWGVCCVSMGCLCMGYVYVWCVSGCGFVTPGSRHRC